MSVTQADIADFSHFARQQISNGGSELTLAQLAMRWQAARERQEVNAAIQEGLNAIDEGRYRSVDAFKDAMRKKHNLPDDV